MKSAVTSYANFRSQLLTEKASLAERLVHIDDTLRALDGLTTGTTGRRRGRPPAFGTAVSRATTPGPRRGRRSFKRARNALSLREAILKALSKGPLTKSEILAGVQKEGYKFTASNPMNSINVLLYTKGLFKKRPGKRFAPAK